MAITGQSAGVFWIWSRGWRNLSQSAWRKFIDPEGGKTNNTTYCEISRREGIYWLVAMNAPCCSTTLKFSKLFRKSLSFTNGFINPRQWNWPDSCQYSIKWKMTSLTDTKCTHSPFSPMSWRATSCWNFSKLSVSSLRWNKMRKGIPSSVSSWKTHSQKQMESEPFKASAVPHRLHNNPPVFWM